MVSLANSPPTFNSIWTSTMKYKDGKKELETDVQVKLADTNYLKLFNIKLLAGSNISYTDTIRQLVINETYMRFLGFKDPHQAIGKLIEWDHKNLPITGVVADFHQRALHDPITPLLFTTLPKQMRSINILLQPQNAEGTVWKTAISKIEKAWKQVYPEDDFECLFLDDTIKGYYTAEKNMSKLLMWATGLFHFYQLPRPPGFSYLYHSAANKRNRHTQSDRCKRFADHFAAVNGFSEAGIHSICLLPFRSDGGAVINGFKTFHTEQASVYGYFSWVA
jgi:hypothetical protein